MLSNGQRVIGRTSATELLSGIKGGGGLEIYLGAKSLEPFINKDLVLEGMVPFRLPGTSHPTATRAYAWSSPIEGSAKRRFFAVLHQPPVDGPQAAVRAAIMAEQRQAGRA